MSTEGQTTASILYARDKEKVNLDSVFVQMKLSVVDEEIRTELIPKISEYSNSQNKVSAADFFATHPFHVQIERMSRRISTPMQEGALISTKWFYERARGQYRDAQAYQSTAQRRKFTTEYPKNQLLVKTDLAKYELTFRQQPHIVCLGAQKCFMEFAKAVDKDWTPEALHFGDGYFRDAMARALIFRWTDRMIAGSEWYLADRAYKSQTVAYTLSYLSYVLSSRSESLDYRRIWNKQELPDSLKQYIESIAVLVAQYIREEPNCRNAAEYCKKQLCWSGMCQNLTMPESVPLPKNILILAPHVTKLRKRSSADREI